MSINLLSFALDGFSPNSNLLHRTLNGFSGSPTGFDYPPAVQLWGTILKTSDGYTVKTSNGYPVSVKSTNDYNYPLTCIISPQKIDTVVIDQ